MINKKSVTIVLALGLIVSIGIALAQDKYAEDITAKELAAKEKGGLISSPSLERPIDQAGITPIIGELPFSPDISDSDQNQSSVTGSGEATQTSGRNPNIDVVFTSYIILQYAGNNLGATIDCYQQQNGLVGSLVFYSDNYTLPGNHANPRYVVLYYHYSRYNDILALLKENGEKHLVFQDPNFSWLKVIPTV